MELPVPNAGLSLREVRESDLDTFFSQLQEPDAVRMAAFTAKDPSDRDAFDAHWARIRADPSVMLRTIEREGRVAGHIASFVRDGEREVTYWIGREYWGRGVATRALAAFLGEDATRPMHARAASDNIASLRVLAKCGFEVARTETGFANARGREIEETVLILR